jgi:hypothetical protein
MRLTAEMFVPVDTPDAVRIRVATSADSDAVLAVDVAALDVSEAVEVGGLDIYVDH